MAASKTEKIRSIFQRCQRLMRAGGLHESDKPLWYDVYAAFPPLVEPLYDRPVPAKKVHRIIYPEDLVRARYYKEIYDTDQVDMTNEQKPTTSQTFVDKYFELRQTDRHNPNLFTATVEALRDNGLELTTWKKREELLELYREENHASAKPSYTASEVFGQFTVDRQAKLAAASKPDDREDMDIDNLAADLFDTDPKS